MAKLWVMLTRSGDFQLMCGSEPVELGRHIGSVMINGETPPPSTPNAVERRDPIQFQVRVEVKLPNLTALPPGWISHDGSRKPSFIPWGSRVDLMRRNGSFQYGAAVQSPRFWQWQDGAIHDPEIDIVAFRLVNDGGGHEGR